MTFTSIICLNAKHTVCNHRQRLFYPFLKFQTGPGGFVLSLLFFLEWLLKGRCWKEESLKSQAEGGSNFLSFVTLSHLIHRKYSRYDWCFFHTVRQYPFISFSSFQFLGGFPSLWFLAAKTKIALARGVKFVGLHSHLRGQSSRFQPSTASSWTSKTCQSGGFGCKKVWETVGKVLPGC